MFKNNIVFAYICGGFAEVKVRPLSDIDISVYLRDSDSLAEYKLRLFDRLSEILKDLKR